MWNRSLGKLLHVRPNITCFVLFAILICAIALDIDEDESNTLGVVKGRNTANIVGGTPSVVYPSYAHVIGFGVLCGATLIHPDILLTAAHCQSAFTFDRRVAIGATFRNGSDATEVFNVVSIYQHPLYSKENKKYDIMLVKINSFSKSPVAAINRNTTVPYDNQLLTIVGFGHTSYGGSVSNILLDAQVNVVPYVTCLSNYNNLLIDNDSMICASAANKDTCQGDSGGPIFNISSNNVVGVVSFGDGCAKVDKPGVYARVSAAVEFIDQGICIFSNAPPSHCEPISNLPTPAPTTRDWSSPQAYTPTYIPTIGPVATPANIATLAPTRAISRNECSTNLNTTVPRRVWMYRQSFFNDTCTSRCRPISLRFVLFLFGWKQGECL
jgi:trypsin